MSLKKISLKKSRFLNRNKLKTRIITNPEEHCLPKQSYFNKIVSSKSILDLPVQNKELLSSFRTRNNQISFITKSTQRQIGDQSDRLQSNIQSDKEYSTLKENKFTKTNYQHFKKTKKIDHIFQSISQRQKEIAKNLLAKQKNCNTIHMDYKQYEQLIQQSAIKPTYFQQVAQRNDFKHQIEEDNRKNAENKKNNTENKRKTDIFDEIAEEKLPKIKLNKFKTTQITQKIRKCKKVQAQTIIGSNLGAFSNISIKQKLEEKEINQQKQYFSKKFSATFTEQSEIASQIDTKLHTIRQEFPSKRFQPTKRSNTVQDEKNPHREKKSVDWDDIPNEKYKQALKNILQIHKKKRINQNLDKSFSKGQEYQAHQQNLLLDFKDIYKTKQFVLKHKFQWRI